MHATQKLWWDVQLSCVSRQTVKNSRFVSSTTTCAIQRRDLGPATPKKKWREHERDLTWLSLCSHGSIEAASASFIVAVNANKNFAIRRAPENFNDKLWDGLEPLPVETGMPELLRRLEHIARFTVIKELRPAPPSAPSSRLASIEVCNGPSTRGRPAALTKLNDAKYEHAYEVEAETAFVITVKNQSQRPLGCVILDCSSDFSMDRVYPTARNGPFQTLEVGQERTMPLTMMIPDDQQQSARAGEAVIDVLKVVVCHPEMVMDSLQLPGLFETSYRRGQTRSLNGLRELLQELDVTRRAYVIEDCPDAEVDNWETMDIKMHIRPSRH